MCLHLLITHLYFVQYGVTALIIAAQHGHLRVVELLIAAMAPVDVQLKVRFNCIPLLSSIVSS